tara:strand:+ start:152 stop:457 length:306 start_codon:yes stop_codon:yes gene_type:complete
MNNRSGLIGFLYILRRKKPKLIKLAWHLENKTKLEKLSKKMQNDLNKLIDYYKNSVAAADKETFIELGKIWGPVKMEGTTRTQTQRGTIKTPSVSYKWMRR